jgi:TorA maturation chaperone TorD
MVAIVRKRGGFLRIHFPTAIIITLVIATVNVALLDQKLGSCESDTADLSNVAASRAEVYRLLSLVYLRSPSEDLVVILRNVSSSMLFRSSADPTLGRIKENLWRMDDHLKSVVSLDDASLRLSVEWTKLFRGVKPGYSPPPPYESVYIGEGLMFGRSTFEVQKEYAESGLNLAEELNGELPDHIGIELDYMRFLAEREAEAWSKADLDELHKVLTLEKRFLKQHLASWVSGFSDTIKKYDNTGFYRRAVEVTESWIGLDNDRLDSYMQCEELKQVP